jgi:GTP-binding protein YchF
VKVGLVGFAASGKTTVFSALSGAESGGGKGALGTVNVPDARVSRLSEMWSPRKTTYAEITFEDFPPGSFAAHSIAAAVLGEMRSLDVLVEVVDGFSEGTKAAAGKGESFHAELLLGDLGIIEKRLERLTREKGRAGEKDLLERCKDALESDKELRQVELADAELETLSGFQFLTLKPRILVVNVAESDAAADLPDVRARASAHGLQVVVMSAPLECELGRLSAAERQEFLKDYGLDSGARERFIAACYSLLDLITFLTAGEDEVRAWPIRRGTTAVLAASKIHSDIARGFIRAEVIAYDDYIELGSEAACRQAGKLKTQGRDYVMRDGDVVHFRFNV